MSICDDRESPAQSPRWGVENRQFVVVKAGALVCFLSLVGACQDREREEGRRLLSVYEEIQLESEPSARRKNLHKLQNTRLSIDEFSELRDICVRAHTAFLEAETTHIRAKNELQRIEEMLKTGVQPSSEKRKQLEAILQSSDNAIAMSRKLFPRCDHGMRSLALRFQPKAL